MDTQKIISSKEKYDEFEKEIENKIKNKTISMKNKECYLIKDFWIDSFKRCYNSYERSLKNKSRLTNNNPEISFPKKNPEFLNDIPSIVEYLKRRNKFKLVNIELMDLLFNNNKKKLINLNFTFYYYFILNKVIQN